MVTWCSRRGIHDDRRCWSSAIPGICQVQPKKLRR